MSDYNEIFVSGVVKSVERKESQGVRNTVFYEAVILSTYTPERSMPKTFEFTVVGFGELGKKLSSVNKNEKIVIKGRMENYSGISKTTGKPYTAFYKIVAKEINYMDSAVPVEKSFSQENYNQNNVSIDDIPF